MSSSNAVFHSSFSFSQPSFPFVYIVILNYNGWADTIECLESVFKNNYPNFQIILIDNNSSDNSVEHIKAWAEGKLDVFVPPEKPLRKLSFPPLTKPVPYKLMDAENLAAARIPLSSLPEAHPSAETLPLIFIRSNENSGFAAGNNLGIRYALTKNDFAYTWLLNNDTVIAEDALLKIVEKAQSVPGIGIAGSKLMLYHSPHEIQALGAKVNRIFGWSKAIMEEKELHRLADIIGASFLISKNCIDEIGLLPEEYFLYHEETDYCLNAGENGFKLALATDSVVYHKLGVSTESLRKDYYSLRNTLYLNRKYFSKNVLATTAYFALRIFKRMFPPNVERYKIILKAIRDFRQGNMGKQL